MKKKPLHKKDPGFKTPEGYFEGLEAAIFEKLSLKKALPEKEGFTVPETYFDTLEDRLQQKLYPAKTAKVIPLARSRKVYYAISAVAAALALFFALKNVFPAPMSMNSVALTEVERYLDNGYLTWNEYDLAEVFEEEDFADITLTTKIDEEALIDYLSENVDSYQHLSLEN